MDCVPIYLRDLLKSRFSSYFHTNWTKQTGEFLLFKDKWSTRLTTAQRAIIEGGDINKWDLTIVKIQKKKKKFCP